MSRPDEGQEPSVDVAIVGAGIAGLVAAWHLRPLRCLVLEAADRAGGRVHSVLGTGGVLNLGAHMVPGAGSAVGDLVTELGLPTRPLPRALFGLRHGERLHLGLAPAALPFALPLSARERVALARLGVALRVGAWRFAHAARLAAADPPEERRTGLLGFAETRTLAAHIGPLPPRIAALFRALTERNGADPDDMSAGHGLRSFANVWAKTAPGLNLVGGTGALPDALADALGPTIRTRCRVTDVSVSERVRVRWCGAEGAGSVQARACVMATPAPVTRALLRGAPSPVATALGALRYGPFLSVGLTLAPGAAGPWQDTYAILTPGLGFSVLFNHAAMRADGEGADGQSLMLFRGASGARSEMSQPDDAILGRWIADLEAAFPAARGRVREARLARWPDGAPYAFPGRSALQPALEVDTPPIALAGDYLDFPNMEAAAQAGLIAARRVRGWLKA